MYIGLTQYCCSQIFLLTLFNKMFGYTFFLEHFTKGDNFCSFIFASWDNEPKGSTIAPRETSSLLQELISIEKGGKIENGRVAPLEVHPFTFT